MEFRELKSVLESLLLASAEPVSIARLASVCDDEPVENVKRALEELANEYRQNGRGFTIEEVAGGYQLRTSLENAAYVRKLLAVRQPRFSRPVLETLAIIAYRQPITRAEIENIRGVDCGGVIDTLLNRRLIRVVGRKAVPGRPLLYGTTPEFLVTFGLQSLDQLPSIDRLDVLKETQPVTELPEGKSSEEKTTESEVKSQFENSSDDINVTFSPPETREDSLSRTNT